MNPPTPASLMEEATETAKIIWNDGELSHDECIKLLASALHSIQAQTIRDMLDACCERCGCDEWLRSYAKDKGIEIE